MRTTRARDLGFIDSMLLQVRKHDGNVEEIENVSSDFARNVATAFDWQSERSRFDQLTASGAEAYFPSIALMDDTGRTLEFGPNSGNDFWVTYQYVILRSTFGFHPVDQQREQTLEACNLNMALELMEHHYRGEHQSIVTVLPAQEGDGEM